MSTIWMSAASLRPGMTVVSDDGTRKRVTAHRGPMTSYGTCRVTLRDVDRPGAAETVTVRHGVQVEARTNADGRRLPTLFYAGIVVHYGPDDAESPALLGHTLPESGPSSAQDVRRAGQYR